jgi:cytochrome b561
MTPREAFEALSAGLVGGCGIGVMVLLLIRIWWRVFEQILLLLKAKRAFLEFVMQRRKLK